MFAFLRNRPGLAVCLGLGAGLILAAGVTAGVLLAVGLIGPAAHGTGGWMIGETPVSASATHSGNLFAMATGDVDGEVEGIYVLDFLTGELSCTVVSPRTAKIIGLFKTSVLEDLDVKNAKSPKFIMVTGSIRALQGEANARPAGSIIYVLEESTGNFAGYFFNWNASQAKTSTPQAGALRKLVAGKAAKKNV